MKEQRSKEWSLVLFRKYENIYFDDIETAKFKFGRTQDEVLENEGEPMSKCLISIVKSRNLQDIVMETGFVISFTTINPKNNANENIVFCFLLERLDGLKRLKIPVVHIVTGIKNSTIFIGTCTMS